MKIVKFKSFSKTSGVFHCKVPTSSQISGEIQFYLGIYLFNYFLRITQNIDSKAEMSEEPYYTCNNTLNCELVPL